MEHLKRSHYRPDASACDLGNVSRELLENIRHATGEFTLLQITATYMKVFGLHQLYKMREQQHLPSPWQPSQWQWQG